MDALISNNRLQSKHIISFKPETQMINLCEVSDIVYLFNQNQNLVLGRNRYSFPEKSPVIELERQSQEKGGAGASHKTITKGQMPYYKLTVVAFEVFSVTQLKLADPRRDEIDSLSFIVFDLNGNVFEEQILT